VRKSEKPLAQGSKRPPARKRRIEVVPVDGEAADVLSRAPRRGRPRLPAEEGKRYPIAIRTTKELKERLERASKASGRSLAQELEFRLERSFEVQDIADAVCPVIARISDQISDLGLFVTLADALRAAGSGATVADALRGGTLADALRGGTLADALRGGPLADALHGSEQAASAARKVPGNRLRAGAAVAPTGRERHRSGER
jgi:predicted DNA-binding protein